MKKSSLTFVFIYLFLSNIHIFAQKQYPQNYFASPLDIPLELAGSFAELRSNHFHSGLDLRTQEKEGFNVYVPANGYVSRIRVSAYGFGNALYVTHPNGYVTVYGHLQSYNSKITAYLRKMQYEKESYEIDLLVPRNKIKVVKGEIIAISGNSGSTEGPHLHYEIRDRKTEHPINPLLFGYKIKDSIPPVIEGIKCFDENSGANFDLNLKMSNGSYYIDSKDTIKFPSRFSMGISTYDLMNNNTAKDGIYQLELWMDTALVNKLTFNRFSFNEVRYINALVNYKTYIECGKKYLQSKILPGNKLSMYNFVKDRGYITLIDSNLHRITYKVSDYEGNSSTLSFDVKKESEKQYSSLPIDSNLLITYNLADTFETKKFKLYFPANTLYENLILHPEIQKNDGNFLSDIINIQNITTPTHKNAVISIKADSIADSLKSKLLIVRINEKGKLSAEGGKYNEGFVRTNINNFGKFAVLIDTIAPIIKPLNYSQKTMDVRQKTLDFRITDDLSGLAKYRAELNGKWVLMEFNGKNNQLTYTIDEKLQIGANQLKITAEDNRQNIRELNLLIIK